MGRLTLNILLSFAQFEREAIGERVRDKIAASKRKGIRVGGRMEERMDQNQLIEELKLQALYDLKGAIKLGEWCELPTEAMDNIRAWAKPPERSTAWDRRNRGCRRA